MSEPEYFSDSRGILTCIMLKFHSLLIINSYSLRKIRLFFHVLVFTHLVVAALYLLNIDFSSSSDQNLRAYEKTKWKLITAWFNLFTIPYLVMSIYCEYYEIKGKSNFNILVLNKLRHFLFSSIILPVTMFADILFWRIYNKDRTLLMPLSTEEYISVWNHHSMHTVSLLFVIFDLVSLPRKRPKDMTPHIAALTIFLAVYATVCGYSLMNGEYVYPGLRLYSTPDLLMICVYVYISNLFYYTGQWFVSNIIWGQEERMKIAEGVK